MARRRLLINLSLPRTRWLIGFFLIAGVVEVFLLTLGGLELLEFTDSPAFCGALCHQVMEPEYTTHQASPHAKVACTDCHVGSGTNYLVRSKVTGIPLILRTLTGRYERPITTPVHSLRPARETCERCHWPQKSTQERIRLFDHFAADENNTRDTKLMVFRMGGGRAVSGVHWHIAARLSYLPLDRAHQEIGWVRVESPQGEVTEYIDPKRRAEVTPERIERESRTFDCMDCHNRATHVFRSPDALLDDALSRGDLDPSLPYIKQIGLTILDPSRASLDEAFREADALADFYRTSYPEVYQQKSREVAQAVETMKDLARLAVFPYMRVTSETHAQDLSHSGCFRCHGKLVSTGPGEAKQVRRNCILCHYDLPAVAAQAIVGAVPTSAALPPVPHSVQDFPDCVACHATGVGGTPKMPADHAGETKDTCLECHQTTPTPQPYVAGGPRPVPHQIYAGEPCLACHAEGLAGAPRVPADHGGRTNEICLACHGLVLTPSARPPRVLHPIFAGEPCFLCHAEGRAGAPVVPVDHAGRTNETCTICHGLTLVPMPAGVQPPRIPHPTYSGEPCLLCHAEGRVGASKMPADHAGRPEDLCTGCHLPTVAPVPASQQPPSVPHPALEGERCLVCHAEGKVGAPKVPADHAGRTNDICLACHRLTPQPTPPGP